MHSDTTQKLSYQPVCPTKPGALPWVPSNTYTPPSVAMDANTTYALSYVGAGGERCKPLIVPAQNELIATRCLPFDDRTIYKESFFGCGGTTRPEPIRPAGQMDACDAQVKMDTATMYNLAYMGHYDVPREPPMRPFEQTKNCRTEAKCPLQDLTTQRHDFVWKAGCKRAPIMPLSMQLQPVARMDTQTTAQMSYQPNPGYVPAKSVQPPAQYVRPSVQMDTNTTQKMSFQPVCSGPREKYQWVEKPAYVRPCVRMDTDTVHHLSYAPPGHYVNDCCERCPCPEEAAAPAADGCPPVACC